MVKAAAPQLPPLVRRTWASRCGREQVPGACRVISMPFATWPELAILWAVEQLE